MSDYSGLWNMASTSSQFSQMPEDEFLALLQKQFQSASHEVDTSTASNKDGNNDPLSITQLSLSGVTPSADDSSPSPATNNAGSPSRRQSNSSYPHQGDNHAQGDETPALKRKASDDDLDEGHNSKNKLGVDESGARKGQTSKRKSTGNPQDESRLLKRKEQNRAAQRAFRERKEKHVKDLEDKVAALEAKYEETETENNNLRDLLSRLQQENVALRQAQFTFSMPKSAPPSAPISQAPSTAPNSNMHHPSSSPFSFFSAPSQSPVSSLGGEIDWGALTTFDPGMLSMLDDPPVGDVSMQQQSQDFSSSPFGQYALPSPNKYRTIANNPWLMTFADTPETPSTTVTTSPVAMTGTNGINAFDAFGFGRFGPSSSSDQSWVPSTGQTPAQTNFNQQFVPSNHGLDDLFSGSVFANGVPPGNGSGQNNGGPMEFGTSFLETTLPPSSISPVSHANGNVNATRTGPNANTSSKPPVSPPPSTSSESSPDTQRSNSSPPLQNKTASSSPLTSMSGSGHSADGGSAAANENSGGLKKRITREDVAKHIAACGESPFTSPSTGCATIGLTPESESGSGHSVLRKASDFTQGHIISCQGSRIPRTEESPDNIEVLQAWRSITSSPCFKDADVNQLCAEFSKKARCDGTKVVLEPEGVRHIIEKFKTKGQQCVPNPHTRVQQDQQHLQHLQVQLQGQL